ncbi:hypothetical protein B5G28_02870 [Faecalibacterium sp. An77]|uniref:hypothetical protein n=1 Tax=Faecalibacterium sp. An77 TaxID=1965655 RepID=UPI000B3AEFCA|nr:hypothetical protein [Faecalibacterium sp. An77]OUN40068.1 hypothetical protein B5G28_02870 [Faecalibacterium sp. An77]
MRKMKHGLVLLLAVLALLVLSGCSQPKQVGTRSMAGAADLIANMSAQTVVTNDAPLDSGTAAAATYMIKSRSTPLSGENTGTLADELREASCTDGYSARSAPTESGVTRMSRLFIYPGDWSEDEVARAIVNKIDEMADELLSSSCSRQVVIDSYFNYTYTYSVSVRQAFSDQASAWVVGIGINQTAKEEHKT